MDIGLQDFMLPCLTKRYFGLDCPGCGTQRAFVSLLEGDVVSAFSFYPPIFTLLLLIGSVAFFVVRRNPISQKAAIISGIAHGVVVITSYVFKIVL